MWLVRRGFTTMAESLSASPVASSRRSRRSSKHDDSLLSVEVPHAVEVEGEGKPRRHPLTANHGPDQFVSTYDDSVHTLYDSFLRSVRLFSNAVIAIPP